MLVDEKLRAIINKPDTLKAVATIDKNGVPHVVFKGSVGASDDGNIYFYELLESSRNGQNLVHSIWFGKKVAINVLDGDRNSYEIVGKPVKCITSGREFEKVYIAVRERLGDVDLSAIWIVEPETVTNETFKVRFSEQEEKYPILKHLDRLVVED